MAGQDIDIVKVRRAGLSWPGGRPVLGRSQMAEDKGEGKVVSDYEDVPKGYLAAGEPELEQKPKKTKWTFMEAALYKSDRNIAIVGIITIGLSALYKVAPEHPDMAKLLIAVGMSAITALGVIVGVRVGSK